MNFKEKINTALLVIAIFVILGLTAILMPKEVIESKETYQYDIGDHVIESDTIELCIIDRYVDMACGDPMNMYVCTTNKNDTTRVPEEMLSYNNAY